MSIPHLLRIAFIALCSMGLAVPASAFGGCCCSRSAEKILEQPSPPAKSCCAGGAERFSQVCLVETECSLRQTCPFCKTPTVVVPEQQTRYSAPPAGDILETVWELPASEPAPTLQIAADPSFRSHNTRLAQISIWRK